MINKSTQSITAATVSGLTACFIVMKVSGRSEAWDSPLYFVAALPAMTAIIFYLAYRNPEKVWRLTIAQAVGQSIALTLSGNSWDLWPLSIIAMIVCSIPQFIAGFVAKSLARPS